MQLKGLNLIIATQQNISYYQIIDHDVINTFKALFASSVDENSTNANPFTCLFLYLGMLYSYCSEMWHINKINHTPYISHITVSLKDGP